MSFLLSILESLRHFFSLRTLEEDFLADATDLADLEHRMQMLERSHTPAFGY